MSDERKTIIDTKLHDIPNQIITDPASGKGRVPQSMQASLAKVHGLITYWELKEPLTVLELAIWKYNLIIRTGGNVENRQQVRLQCGRDMQVIISGVLQFFEYNTDE